MWNYLCSLPPEHHSTANAEPDAGPDEIASDEMADRVEPCDDADVKSDPIEPHYEHEEYRNRPHSLSSHRHVLLHHLNPPNPPQHFCPKPPTPPPVIAATNP